MNKFCGIFSEAKFIFHIGLFLLLSIIITVFTFLMFISSSKNTIIKENIACHATSTKLGDSNAIYLVVQCDEKPFTYYIGGQIVVDVIKSHNNNLICNLYTDNRISDCKQLQ